MSLGVSAASNDTGLSPAAGETVEYIHVGARAGFGVEARLTSWIAVNTAIRVFVLENVSQENSPEYQEVVDGRLTGRGTDTAVGLLPTMGMTLYF
ncbi:MAG: hypothetical protein R3A78_03075 [Polyangiales bacterium]